MEPRGLVATDPLSNRSAMPWINQRYGCRRIRCGITRSHCEAARMSDRSDISFCCEITATIKPGRHCQIGIAPCSSSIKGQDAIPEQDHQAIKNLRQSVLALARRERGDSRASAYGSTTAPFTKCPRESRTSAVLRPARSSQIYTATVNNWSCCNSVSDTTDGRQSVVESCG